MPLARLLLPACLGLAVTACFDKSSSDDDDDDDDVGADTGSAWGSDGGGLEDGDPDGGGGDGGSSSADSDGDGLSDAEEAELGTDPDAADTDGDGWSDGDEVAAGTGPLNSTGHPYELGGYNVGDCAEAPTATTATGPHNDYVTTWAKGDVPDNFVMTDQHGQEVELYSFCGQHIMIAFGSMWCRPCQSLAAEVQDHQDHYGPDGFQAIEVLIGDYSDYDPDQADLQDWADTYGMETVPVLDDGAYEFWPWYEVDWGIPTVVHIGPDMKIRSVDEYIYDPGRWF